MGEGFGLLASLVTSQEAEKENKRDREREEEQHIKERWQENQNAILLKPKR